MRQAITILVTGAALAGAGAAVRADESCAGTMATWKPRAEVEKLAATQGWVLRRINIEDGCYEIVGTDSTGHPIEIIVDPNTLHILATRQSGEDREAAGLGKTQDN